MEHFLAFFQVKTQKTALQLAQEELERENQLKYYEVHEYKVQL